MTRLEIQPVNSIIEENDQLILPNLPMKYNKVYIIYINNFIQYVYIWNVYSKTQYLIVNVLGFFFYLCET